MSVICVVVLLAFGLPSVLGTFGMSFPNLTSFIPNIVGLLLVMISSIWLAIDGFGEEHLLKTISLITAGILALYFAATVVNLMGWIAIPIPGFVEMAKGWLYCVAAVLLLIGIFAYQ